MIVEPGAGDGSPRGFTVDSKGTTEPTGLGKAAGGDKKTDAFLPIVEEDKGPERIGAQRAKEVGWLASALFSRKRTEPDFGPDNPNKAARALDTAHFLGNLRSDQEERDSRDKKDDKTVPTKRESANTDLANGKAGDICFMVGDTKVKLVEILDTADPKKFACKYQAYEMVPDADGKLVPGNLDTSRTIPATGEDALNRADVVDSYLVFEQDTIKDGFTDPAEKAIVETHFKLIDPNVPIDQEPADTPELQKQMEQVAKDKLLTVYDAGDYLRGLVKNNMCTAEDVEKVFDVVGGDGAIVVSPEGVRELLRLGGMDAEGMSDKIQALGQEKDELRAQLAKQDPKSPEGKDTQRKIDQAEASQQLLGTTAKLLETKDDQGRDPIDKFFDDAYAGKVDFKAMEGVIDAFRNGDMDTLTKGMMTEIPIPPGLTDDEKKKFVQDTLRKTLNVAKKGGKPALIAAGVPLGIIGLLLAAVSGLGSSVMSGAMNHN